MIGIPPGCGCPAGDTSKGDSVEVPEYHVQNAHGKRKATLGEEEEELRVWNKHLLCKY